MRWARRDDRGAVTAEFVVVLPAVLAVLVVALVAVLLAAQRVTLTSAAFEISRLEARGDTAAAATQLGRLADGTTVTREREGPLHCVRLSAHPGAVMLAAVEISARGCAAFTADTGAGSTSEGVAVSAYAAGASTAGFSSADRG